MAHAKAIELARGVQPLGLYLLDEGRGWPAVQKGEQPLERGPWTFSDHLHTVIETIGNPTGETQPNGFALV